MDKRQLDIELWFTRMFQEVAMFFVWLRTTPKTKLERQDKMITLFFITIWVVATIGIFYSYLVGR